MAIILNIDSAVETASVCLAEDKQVLSFAKNVRKVRKDSVGDSFGAEQKDHAAWLHVAIKQIFEKNDLEIRSIDAVAITQGPGSYTGLRIGMATAKGICFALDKPLITLNTLLVMANAAKNAGKGSLREHKDLLCPMIDARRLEVFTALYTPQLQSIKEPAALTLNEKIFDEELANSGICFFGNGSNKFQKMKAHPNANFSEVNFDATAMVSLAEEKFNKKEFADLAYAEPLYLKEFYTPARSSFSK